jgi:hypothetical protein
MQNNTYIGDNFIEESIRKSMGNRLNGEYKRLGGEGLLNIFSRMILGHGNRNVNKRSNVHLMSMGNVIFALIEQFDPKKLITNLRAIHILVKESGEKNLKIEKNHLSEWNSMDLMTLNFSLIC